jgi:hypothetical protein
MCVDWWTDCACAGAATLADLPRPDGRIGAATCELAGLLPADAFEIVEADPKLLSPFPDGDHILWWSDAEKSAAGIERFGSREPVDEKFMLRHSGKKLLKSQRAICSLRSRDDLYLGPS